MIKIWKGHFTFFGLALPMPQEIDLPKFVVDFRVPPRQGSTVCMYILIHTYVCMYPYVVNYCTEYSLYMGRN